ncbi:hypothetical protein H4R20_004861 [Coemansia guatemalensis]|uniref:CUE domain-containing protein n=1 Tax=Coemansia guatemalensis TaxID=2761395 RepID=A0A9W8HSJ3_9FUNG|nr:hypothetical protein H4R20_004861 [Coemansia guatemalensis]
MTNTLQRQIDSKLEGPSDSSYIAWLVDEATPLNAAIEHALLDKFDETKTQASEQLPQELVLKIYEKLDESLQNTEAQEQARSLQTSCVLVGATMFDLACSFCKSEPERLQTLLDKLCEHAPWMETEIEASADLLIEQLEHFQDKYAEHVKTEEGDFDDEFVGKISDDIEWYQSMSWSWLCLIEFCPLSVSALLQDSRFILELAKTSDVATKLLLKLGNDSHSAAPDKILACKELIKKLKWQWIGLAYEVLKPLFKSTTSGSSTDNAIGQQTNISVLLDILEALETSDTSLTPFENAPFLLDLEFRFGLRQMITIATAMTGQLDSAQLEYVTMSIEQLMSMTKPLYRDGLESLSKRVQDAEEPLSDVDAITDALAAVSLDKKNEAAAIAQVQEMIPNLGKGFVRACLSHYNNNAEAVVNALLEDNLPPSLAEIDRANEDWTAPGTGGLATAASKVLESRRNVFDKDEFDIFHHNTLDWSRVRKGKSQNNGDVGKPDDEMLARVMELARRIAEEDEYDDTYDETAQDAGVVDTPDAMENAAADPIRPWEGDLVRQYESDPSVLERGKDARKSAARQALRAKTGLSDEQIEGWYIMFQRNPNRQRVLDNHNWNGEQTPVERPSSSASKQSADGGGKPAKANHNQKEKNKAKVGNHDRKKQHSRKMQNA